jgi:hypothetical protein
MADVGRPGACCDLPGQDLYMFSGFRWGETMKHVFAIAAAAMVLSSTGAGAVTYDLAADFSNALNPNNPWSFTYLGSPLAHQTPTLNGNPLIPAVQTDGFWGQGPDLNTNTPEIMKVTKHGSQAGLTDLDFLTGDVVLHSPNDGNSIDINFTVPTTAIYQVDLAIWYAHSSVARVNQMVFLINGNPFVAIPVDSSANRDHPLVGNAPFNLNSGDVVTVSVAKNSGQTFGSLNGIALSFTTSAVPEPASWAMMVVGIGAVGFAMRRHARMSIAAA